MKEQKEDDRAERLGRNVCFLRHQADLTVQGAAAGISLSVNHFRRIEAGEVNIRARTSEKICDFFSTDIETLYAVGFPPVREIEEMPAMKRFREANKGNHQFFISLKDKNSVASFLKEVLLKERKYFRNDRRDVAAIVNESNSDEYKKNFKSKEVSRELIRLVKSGKLERKDKTGTGKRYWYYEPEKSGRSSIGG